MRKSSLFISAMLTTIMLAVMFGVVSAYRQIASTPQPEVVATSAPAVEVQSVDQFMSVAPTQTGVVTPEQATTFAMQMIGRSDVYSVESTTYENVPAYLVTFSSGDLVYVSPTGQILAVTKLEPVVVVAPTRKHHNNEDVQASTSSGGQAEEHDEHEDGDD